MGLFGFGKDEREAEVDADAGIGAKTANAIVSKLMDVGIDGLGPLDSVARVVEEAMDKSSSNSEKAINDIVRSHVKLGAAGGFLTGVGGFVTMVASMPANIAGFYVLATRMVASIAKIRGYDLSKPEVRTAVLLTLVGADSQELLAKAGVAATGRLSQVAMSRLPRAAVMIINKGVGFKLATQLGSKTLSRLGRFVPVLGGGIGAGVDGYLMNRIGDHAREEFPARALTEPVL